MRCELARELLLFGTIMAVVVVLVLSVPQPGNAIPAFSRKYQTSCTTCHVDFPKLNDFGKAFKDAGFKFPQDDESFIKEPPVMLGAPAQKENWPHTVWPGTIPGMPPIGLRMNNFFQFTSANRGNFNALTPSGTIPQFVPRTDFETGFFSIFTAGNFGSDIAFWVDDDISISGSNGNGGLGDGYLKFVDVSRFLKMPKDTLSLRVGQFELDLPFTQARSINLSPYDIYLQANIGAMNPFFGQQNVNNQFAFADPGKGIELSGGHLYRGYHYSFAVVDQNTSGLDQGSNTSPFVPSATGSANGGVGFASDSNFKSMYGRVSYRFNLEKNQESRRAIQAAGPTGPRDHTYLNLGTYYYYGRSVQRFEGQDSAGNPAVLTAREPYYRTGADFSFNYRKLNLYGFFMYGHDHSLLPIDATGVLIPLPVTPAPAPVGFVRGRAATFSGGFLQADYLALPWIMVIMRYDGVNSTADRINGLPPTTATNTSFLVPFNSTRSRYTPGVQFLIRANIKASFEYQFRPRQTVTFVTNSTTNLPMASNPFRTNSATVGLEFVY